MFVRNVSLRLKQNSLTEFTQIVNDQVIPALRKQKGFLDEVTFSTSDEVNVTAISIWDSQENADAYADNADGYARVLKTLDKVLDGAPKVRASKVINSTFQKAAVASAETAPIVQPPPVGISLPAVN